MNPDKQAAKLAKRAAKAEKAAPAPETPPKGPIARARAEGRSVAPKG